MSALFYGLRLPRTESAESGTDKRSPSVTRVWWSWVRLVARAELAGNSLMPWVNLRYRLGRPPRRHRTCSPAFVAPVSRVTHRFGANRAMA
jgi:hypothetical protein